MPGLAELNAWIELQLAGAGGGLGALPLLFLGGLAASLLPCVYPLYPITASIVRARGGRPWEHPLLYYLGLVTTYAAFGAIAALTGGLLNEIMRYALTNLLIGVLFVVLALSIADLWHIPLFHDREVAAGEGRAGTVVLGMSAGLLSSACVGPVVVGILLGVAVNVEAATFGTVAGATGQMIAFGMGLGVPFLAIGLFGVALPKAGRWMRWVQVLLAALIGLFAWTYLEKGLLIAGLSNAEANSALIAATVLLIALYYWQEEERPPTRRTQKAFSGVMAASAMVLLLRAALPEGAAVAPAGSTMAQAANRSLVEVKHNLSWHLEDQAAYDEAKARGSNVFIDFYAHWCANCKAFEQLTGDDPALNAALKQAVLLKIYDTSPTFETYAADPRFAELNVGLPFFVITDATGHLLYKTTDYLKTDEMALFLEP
ncbi:MAG: cytochrome c biogenesis protein CcdA [Pseudomonadota bacterium]